MSITHVLDVISSKQGDSLILAVPATLGIIVSGSLVLGGVTDSGTLVIQEVDDATGKLLAPVPTLSGVVPTGEFKGEHFWAVPINTGTFTAKTYYRAKIEYSGTGGAGQPNFHNHHVDDGGPTIDSGTDTESEVWMLHINDDREFQDRLIRSAGLAGDNMRKTDFVYAKANPIEYTAKLYPSATAVLNADSGTADAFVNEYEVQLTYDNRFNRIKQQSKRKS